MKPKPSDKLAGFPRARLGHFPTPLAPLDNLRRALGTPARLFIKRDDCAGLALGGASARKLEFLMGQALARQADAAVTAGDGRSGHLSQTAAAAARCDMDCRLLLAPAAADSAADNAGAADAARLLGGMLGARCEALPAGADGDAAARDLCARLRDDGRTPYFIPGAGANPTGALGYAAAAAELLRQCDDLKLRPTCIVVAADGGGAQAGLLAGMALLGRHIPVLGFSARRPAAAQAARTAALALATAELLNSGCRFNEERVAVDDRCAAPDDAAAPAAEVVAAVKLLARSEGVALEPGPAGRAFAGLLARLRAGEFDADDAIIFLHTGAAAGLFSRWQALSAALRRPSAPPLARAA